MVGKQRLELTWIGKDNRPKLEPRILLEGSAVSNYVTGVLNGTRWALDVRETTCEAGD